MRKTVRFFVSYAHLNASLADDFLNALMRQLRPSKAYDYRLWRDTMLLVGENWDDEIRAALASSDLGMFLITPDFLSSEYIKNTELPAFMNDPSGYFIAILLANVDFLRHDLHGLERYQIFGLPSSNGTGMKAYADCSTGDRRLFTEKLFGQIESRLDKISGLFGTGSRI